MGDECILRKKALEAIIGGKLPTRKPDRTLGGLGSGKTCAVCSELLTPDSDGARDRVQPSRLARTGHVPPASSVLCGMGARKPQHACPGTVGVRSETLA